MDVSCFGFSDGAIEVSATGGYESYTFSIHPDIGTQSPAGTFHGLTSGMFLINAFNDNGEPCRPLEVKLEEPHQSITILEQPRDQTDCYGNTVSFFVTVAGFSGIPLYQWQQRPPGGNFTDIIDANSPVLTIHDIGVKGMNIDGTQYRVLVTDNCHTLISMEALLRINSITNLIPQAVNRTICSGETITYEVLTQGEVVRNGYQWSWNNGTGWIALSDDEVYLGTSTSRLTISNASPCKAGNTELLSPSEHSTSQVWTPVSGQAQLDKDTSSYLKKLWPQ